MTLLNNVRCYIKNKIRNPNCINICSALYLRFLVTPFVYLNFSLTCIVHSHGINVFILCKIDIIELLNVEIELPFC